MSDFNQTDEELTRPSKRIISSDPDNEETRPVRPPGDSDNTVVSPPKKPTSEPPMTSQKPASPTPASPEKSTSPKQSIPQPPAKPPAGGRSPHPTGDSVRRRRPVTYRQRTEPKIQPARPSYKPTVAHTRQATPPPKKRTPISWWRVIVRSLALLSFLIIISGVLLVAGSVVGYFYIASQLPPAEELRLRSFQFATTQILDRDGNLLWEIIDPTGGRRTTVTLDQISPELIEATIATEDRFFYVNVGVDPIAIARAVYYNLSEGEIVSGASTITQQLARNVLLSQDERSEQSLARKIKEAVLAVEINRRYTKEQILEIYLNQIYYGNLAYGIEAAAQTYFGKSADELTLPEAALLAGLPQSPALHDPYQNPDGARARQADVLRLMVEAGYISPAEAEAAKLVDLQLRDLNAAFEAPHFVTYVRQELERIIPPEYIYQAGLTVKTTLDPRLQAAAEEEIRNQVNALAGRNVTNGALVAMDTSTGEILAMVGSKDFRDETIDGQVNMAISPRQPGSTMKPITYLTTFEQLNYTPSTLFMDVPVEYPDGAGGLYKPQNYDEKFHGPVLLREALANSYNIPPIKAMQAVGLEAVKEMAARLGITTLNRNDYGLSLTLGSGEVPLIEMIGAFQAMANGGVLVPPTAILEITDSFGLPVTPARPQPQRVLRPEHAYLITHIMSDNEARTPSFGANSYLRLSRPAAAKTGTTDDFRDNWTIGYTPDIVTGVWVGNANRTPMVNVSGLTGAGPIWHNFMERAHEGLPVRDFTRPETIVELEVCADSGTIPSEVCPERKKEIFFRDQPPLGPEHDIHQLIEIDRNTGLRANEFCRANVEERYYRVYPPDGKEWALKQGIEQPPVDYCPSTNIIAKITNPPDGSAVRGMMTLEGAATAANFSHFQIELGEGTDPETFSVIREPVNVPLEQGVLGVFDTTQVKNGPYTVRVVVFDQAGGVYDSRVRVLVDNLQPTVTPTYTSSPTSTITPTATPTQPLPTDTPTPEPSPTDTVEPPTPTPTELPVELPTETVTSTPTTVQPSTTPATTTSPTATPTVTATPS